VLFHRFSTSRGCQSYLVGCEQGCVAILIDPEDSLEEQYLARASQAGTRILYLLDTHTHADHFSATAELSRKLDVPVIMHRASPAPFVGLPVDDGETIRIGTLALNILYTPGHTADSMCVQVEDRVFTGDTLLIGSCGRSDLPTGDLRQLYHSLFDRLLLLDPATRVHPAHIYHDRLESTIGEELVDNPRLQVADENSFVTQMQSLTLPQPDHLTEALRTNLSGGKTVEQLIAEAAQKVSFMSLDEVRRRLELADPGILLLDVREREAYERAHLPGARLIPRGQLELCVNEQLPDPTQRIVVYCEYGRISTLAAATLRSMGYRRAVALDRGMKEWRELGYPLE